MNKEGFLYTVIFTFIVAFVFIFGLSLANETTRELVKESQENAFYSAILQAAGFEPGDDPAQTFNENFPGVNANETDLFKTQQNGRTIWIRRFSGAGLWGTITGVMAVNDAVDRIIGLQIISHSETPGLGGRIEEKWFTGQFRNEYIGSGKLEVTKGTGEVDEDSENQQVDGITGASLTSSSMEVIVNRSIANIKAEKGGN